MSVKVIPAYSHGGASQVNWPTVAGTTTNSGRPIDIGGADPEPATWPVIEIFCTGGTATVLIEANGGALDSSGNPPTAEWIDISGGGYAMTASTNQAKRIPPNLPYLRTRISAISGATVVSYVSLVVYPEGKWASPTYPTLRNSSVA